MGRMFLTWKQMSYQDVILTIIAVLLGANLLHGIGLLGSKAAHADAPMPVVIVEPKTIPGGYIPVAIMSPLSISGSLCANPCR